MRGIDLREGTELSKTFHNTRDHYKIVEVGNVLAYVILTGGRDSTARVTPLYRADIFHRIKVRGRTTWSVTSSFEYGEPLNGFTFYEDYEGCTFATIASQAVNALENRARTKDIVEAAKRRLKRQKRQK